MAKKENFKELNIEQLKAKLSEEEKEYQKRRFTKETGELSQTHLLAESKANIARIKTAIRSQEIAEGKTK